MPLRWNVHVHCMRYPEKALGTSAAEHRFPKPLASALILSFLDCGTVQRRFFFFFEGKTVRSLKGPTAEDVIVLSLVL